MKRNQQSSSKFSSPNSFLEERVILEALMENTLANLAYLDSKFNFIQVNITYANNSGYKREELIGKNHFDLFPNKENENVFKKVVRTGQSVEFYRKPFTYPNQPERGVTYWNWTLVPVKNDQDKVQGLVLSLVDVSDDVKNDLEKEKLLTQIDQEKSRVEKFALEAQQQASRLDAVFKALVDAVVVYDINGKTVAANPAAVSLFGVDPVGESRVSLAKMIRFRDEQGRLISKDKLPSTQALNKKVVYSQKYVLTDHQGQENTVLASASPIFTNNKVSGAVVITHDISTYQKLEKQKDDFIAIASHELKTPVTTIKAFAQILRKKWSEASDAESKHFLQKMDLQVDKLTVLIRQLLDVGKLQSGELKIHKQMFNLDSLIENIIDDFQQTTETHTIIKDGKLGTKIRADKNLITQVLNNLISNAIKYSPEAKKVIVKVKKQPNEVLIGVQDFGIGIPKESREKIFDRFFRINDTNGQRFPGLGLGLYISKEIISKHNGRVWVESNGSKGSTFFFTLPVKVK